MKKLFSQAVTLLALVAMTAPALATTPDLEMVDPNQDSTELVLERGLVPADLLDSSEYQIDYVNEEAEAGLVNETDSLYQRRPGPGRPGPGRPGPGRPGPRPPRRPVPPPRRAYQCESRDRAGYIYQARDWDLQRARWEAVRTCERRTRAGGCRLLGCR